MSYSCTREGRNWDGVTCPSGETYTTAGKCPDGTRCSVSNSRGRCCGSGTRAARGCVAAALKSVGVSQPLSVAGAIAAVPNVLAAIDVLKGFADRGDTSALAELAKLKDSLK